MENPLKVQKKLNELNKGLIKKPWIVVDGFHAVTGFEFGRTPADAQFNSGFGYPIKTFVNTDTGEVRFFTAYMFRN